MSRTFRGEFRSVKGPRGAKQKAMKLWLYKFFQAHRGTAAEIDLDKMLAECNMDKGRTTDYNAAMSFLHTNRCKLKLVLDDFLAGDYSTYQAKGLDDTEIWERLMDAAVSYEIYPLRSDAAITPGVKDARYRLMTLADFTFLKEKRMQSLVSEVKEVVPMFLKLSRAFPELRANYEAPALPAPDGMLRVTCEICGKTFAGQKSLVAHYLRSHGGEECGTK